MSDVNFKCRRCGTCCKWPGYVRLFSFEADKIAEFMNMDVHEFIENYTVLTRDRRNLSLIENDDHSCIFYRDDPPACMIEPVKPRQCREFPLKWRFEGWEKFCRGAKYIENILPDDKV